MPDTTAGALTMVRRGLHDLAQPMTALQCRLWLGVMEAHTEEESCQAMLREALEQCERMIGSLRELQSKVDEAMSLGVQ